ncbi:MAG: cell division protein FtsZ [Armatimonadetes bacterium]|nr:cell division protein FtsZ [Armatimonadota bacterium]
MADQSGLHPAADVSGARIRVVGVGGAGTNAVNRMIEAGLSGVEFIAMNTDALVLETSLAPVRLHLGEDHVRGLGAGGRPEVGRAAAEQSKSEIKRLLDKSDMVFITAGMGGGTGTGAAPVVAEVAREMGALTVAVVTKPFAFEGPVRGRTAEQGVDALRSTVDTVITVPNDRLLSIADKRVTLVDAFRMADEVLRQGVQGISDIITIAGVVNVDFADVEATMRMAGTAIMGVGAASGDRRAVEAARLAISSPLLECSIEGALRVLINVTSGPDLTLPEVHEATQMVTDLCDPRDANIYFGWVCDPDMVGEVRVTVLATGFGSSPSSSAARSAAAAVPKPAAPAPPAPEPRRVAEPYRLPEAVTTAPVAAPVAVAVAPVAAPAPPPADEIRLPDLALDNRRAGARRAPADRAAGEEALQMPAFLRRG